MQQRQPRLGDILDDYCPRERRITNHAVVAMIGHEVKQTRCTTCEADHEYKHAKVPRQRRKSAAPAALFAQAASGPKRRPHDPDTPRPAAHDAPAADEATPGAAASPEPPPSAEEPTPVAATLSPGDLSLEETGDAEDAGGAGGAEEGPVHRQLIRATLPRAAGQPPPQRPAPEFTIRQPGGRHNRFRPRQQRGTQFFGGRPGGNAGGNRQPGGRPPHPHHGHGHGPAAPRHDRPPHKRSK